ncbi:response regulator transcription factor [Gayadomonas joobiniege]|uniref:response regulator transcription factor n=1 Tax=Gayadomonas joobiniege TaxID=1234606 RepID=UPI0003797972|nr:response regulator [Gayadomonas joobiniege]
MAKILIIEDEISFSQILCKRLNRHGHQCFQVASMEAAFAQIIDISPDAVVLDMKLGEQNSLLQLPKLRQKLPAAKIILLTGFASIATAVEAIKAGADDYLAKPVATQALLKLLFDDSDMNSTGGEQTEDIIPSPARVEWEHIQQVLKLNQGNISQTARQLGMHRRTLQRKLLKKPAR